MKLFSKYCAFAMVIAVALTANALPAMGKGTHGLATIGYDDEGVETQQFDIVRDGTLVGYQLNRQMAQAIGIRVHAVIAATFGFGTALAGIAGVLLANQFFVYPTGGIPLSVYAYIAVVIGGWGSIAGAVIGATMISLFQVVVSAYVSYAVATGLLYVALLLVFFFRPQGIFGELVRRRV